MASGGGGRGLGEGRGRDVEQKDTSGREEGWKQGQLIHNKM